jgi:hypothetical protein
VNPRRKNGVIIMALIAALVGGYALGRHQTQIVISAAAAGVPERPVFQFQGRST